MKKIFIVCILLILGFIGFMFFPICKKIPEENLKAFNVPIDQRTDKDFYVKVFQKKDGVWMQCKTRISWISFG